METLVRPELDPRSAHDVIAALEATGEYRVMRRLHTGPRAPEPQPEGWKSVAIVDVQTTGSDPNKDVAIEVAAMLFAFDPATGAATERRIAYAGLQDPGREIPEAMTAIHGLGKNDVAGRSIDLAEMNDIINSAEFVVGHNAAYDHHFLRKLDVDVHGVPWACSMRDVDWRARGFDGAALRPLLMQTGWFVDGRRATHDCAALHKLLTLPHAKGPAILELAAAARRVDIRLYAENAGYDKREALKLRGYRWSDGMDGRPKAWFKDFPETEADREEKFLKETMIRARGALPRERITAVERYATYVA